jgi:hypothetical protein
MKISITIKYSSGESATYQAGLPEWAKWERKTGKSIYSMKDISAYQQADFLDLAYFAYKRDAAGKPTKSNHRDCYCNWDSNALLDRYRPSNDGNRYIKGA